MGVESLPALCDNCEHHAKLPEHTHEQGGFANDFPLSQVRVSSVAGALDTTRVDLPQFTILDWNDTNLLS
jgi:hypothetical protein